MQSWRDISPIMWKGHCPDCNEPTAHYRKLDHEWVYYNQCWVCGAVFNLRTESINPLEEAVKRFNRMRRFAKSFIIGFGNRKLDKSKEES